MQKLKYLKKCSLLSMLFASIMSNAQNEDKNLKAIFEKSTQDTAKVNMINELAYNWYRKDPDKTLEYGTKARELAEKINYQSGLAEAYKNIGLGYYLQGSYEKALRNWEPSLRLYELTGDERGVANILSNMGSIYYTLGNYVLALQDYLKALPMAEKMGDSIRISTLVLNLGNIYSELLSAQDSALIYYHRALNIGESIGYFDLINLALINLGEFYLNNGNLDSSLYYFNKSLAVVSGNIDKTLPLTNIGKIYAEKGDFKTALKYQRDAVQLATEKNAALELAKALNGIGFTYEKQGAYQMAIDNYEHAKEKAKAAGLNEELSEAYQGLSSSYAALEDYRNAYKYISLRNEIDNALFRQKAEDKSNKMIFAYQLNQKQDEIASLEQQAQIEKLKVRRQRSITIATGSLGLFILMLAGGLYSRMQYVRRTNEMIRKQRDEIESQRNEIEKQRDKIQLQHDTVYAQKEMITDSISYAQRIQSAMLPPETVLKGMTRDYFILFKPKDIVSGDFYWVKQVQDHLVIVNADCTGHGVPGAFMSMLGITLLNDLIGDRCYNAPSAILENLRAKIKEMLAQEGEADEQKDGIDMAIAVLDTKNRELHYAGANNPLYIVRNKKFTDDFAERPDSVLENGEFSLFEVKADKQPIGVHWEETSFRNHSISLRENDTIYLFSDGYIDQFGGEPRKKFKSLNFKKLLLSIQSDSMNQQKQILEQTFEEWRGKFEQVDDVSVIGVRV
jgi:serine phosphatase RsbU (regulator of sigma subunit)